MGLWGEEGLRKPQRETTEVEAEKSHPTFISRPTEQAFDSHIELVWQVVALSGNQNQAQCRHLVTSIRLVRYGTISNASIPQSQRMVLVDFHYEIFSDRSHFIDFLQL